MAKKKTTKKAMKKAGTRTRAKKTPPPTPAPAPAAVHSFFIDAATQSAEAEIALTDNEYSLMVEIYKENPPGSGTFDFWVADMWFDGYHASGREIWKCNGFWFPLNEPEAGRNYQCRCDYYEYNEGTVFGTDSA